MKIKVAVSKQIELLLAIMNIKDVSRHILSRELSLSFPSVTRIVDQLLAMGLVVEGGKVDTGSRAGPKPRLLTVRNDLGVTIGVDLEGFMVRAVALDFANNIIYSSKSQLKSPCDSNVILQSVSKAVEDALKGIKVKKGSITSIGLGVPGYIDQEQGLMKGLVGGVNSLGLPLRDELEKQFGHPVTLDKNINCVARSEFRIGPHARSSHNMAVILARFGVGCSLIVNNVIVNFGGERGGELGHTTIMYEGPECICGSSGCLEAFSSGWSIACRLAGKKYTDRDIPNLYGSLVRDEESPDEDLRREIIAGSRYLGIGIANLIKVVGARAVLVTGFYERCSDEVLVELRKACDMSGCPQTEIVIGGLGEFAGAIGAAMAARDEQADKFFISNVFTDGVVAG